MMIKNINNPESDIMNCGLEKRGKLFSLSDLLGLQLSLL
jgi:hypothetical protein